MIIASRITAHRSIITVPPLISGDRTFVTIHGMTSVGTQVRTGLDILRIGAGATVIGRITAEDLDIEAIAASTVEGTLRVEQER